MPWIRWPAPGCGTCCSFHAAPAHPVRTRSSGGSEESKTKRLCVLGLIPRGAPFPTEQKPSVSKANPCSVHARWGDGLHGGPRASSPPAPGLWCLLGPASFLSGKPQNWRGEAWWSRALRPKPLPSYLPSAERTRDLRGRGVGRWTLPSRPPLLGRGGSP